MSKRITAVNGTSIHTRERFLEVVDEIATLDTARRIQESKRDKKIQAIQAEYEPILQRIKDGMGQLLLQAEQYAAVHRTELFPEGKTADTELAEYGFRCHPPSLILLNRKWTWDLVKEAIKAKGRAFAAQYLRVKEEPVKEALKAHLPADELASIGLTVESKETFGVTPKLADAEAVKS